MTDESTPAGRAVASGAADAEASDDDVRRARFGRLPDRVAPDDRVELVETDPPREVLEPREPRREWG